MKRLFVILFVLVLMTISVHAATSQSTRVQTLNHGYTLTNSKFSPGLLASAGSPLLNWEAKKRAKTQELEVRGVIQKIKKFRIKVSGKNIFTNNAIWLDHNNRPLAPAKFKKGDRVEVKCKKLGIAFFAQTIKRLADPDQDNKKVALLFVAHGEPVTRENGDVPITLADGTPFGPHAADLDVPPEFQYTEWAAAYEEIATAMTYILLDFNRNGILHEVAMYPAGDVPPFFSWDAFHASVYEHYEACENHSPHNELIREHVESLKIKVDGANIDVYLAFLDAVPRITDVVWDIRQADQYDELVVVPMLIADSTHTQEVTNLVKEAEHLTEGMQVLVTEPFFEVPFVKRRMRDAITAMARHLRDAVPENVEDYKIGVVLASHGTPYVQPFPEFGWQEGDIFSYLIPTEDEFHKDIARRLPWMCRTGRMSYSSPTIEDALAEFEVEGFTHIMVVPSAFPTTAIHTMWDVADAAVGKAVLPKDGVVTHTRPSGVKVYYSAEGFADFETGREEFREGLGMLGKMGVIEALAEPVEDEVATPYEPCPAGQICVLVTADQVTGSKLRFLLYEVNQGEWPQDYQALPPDWVVIDPPAVPDHFPARIQIPVEDSLLALSSKPVPQKGIQLGLVIAAGEGPVVEPTDTRWYSPTPIEYGSEGSMNFGAMTLYEPEPQYPCLPGEICVTVTAQEVTGPDLKLMLYIANEDNWPQDYLTLPTPSWVVTKTEPVPDSWPIHIQIPLVENLFAFSSEPLEGARLGLAVVTGVAANFVVEPTDARGFSAGTLVYQSGAVMNYGNVELRAPLGDACELNPYHPDCLTGPLFWKEHFLGPENFVPGAIYLDVADIDGDGTEDIVMVGEPHFEEPELPLTVLKLGVYYLNEDFTVRDTEIIDQWSESDQLFYSPWGVRVIEHSGNPMIIVGCNIPGLAPLEDGTGVILSYRPQNGAWVREIVRENPNPTVTNYNAMIVVPADIDGDGDQDLGLSGAFQSSSVGSWMENTGKVDDPWIPHLKPMDPGTDPYIRGTLAYKSADLNGDGYPEMVHNAMFDIPNTNPPRYRGEIWLAVNPGPADKDAPWQKVVIDDDNWASADMWFHDFNGDGYPDLVANQIFNSTVTVYIHPGNNLADPWQPVVIVSGLTSPSDMWLADMDNDGLMDVVSADHTAHRGVWHKNPGTDLNAPWLPNLIYRNIRLPGDFAMVDIDNDNDLDWVGTSMTLGQAFIVEQVSPDSSLVAAISLPDSFSGQIKSLMVTLAGDLPVTGPPAATLVTVQNVDADDDGTGDVDQILKPSRDLVLAIKDVGVTGDYHVVVTLFMEGGGQYIPVPGVDYMTSSAKLTFGQGKQDVALELKLVSVP